MTNSEMRVNREQLLTNYGMKNSNEKSGGEASSAAASFVLMLIRNQLSDSTDCSPPGSSVHGIFQARISSVKFSHSVVSDSLRPHGLQQARPPCPSPTPGGHQNSCPLSR